MGVQLRGRSNKAPNPRAAPTPPEPELEQAQHPQHRPGMALRTLPSDSQQMGASHEQTGQLGDQDPREQADGKWGAGQDWHTGASPTGWGALAGLSLPRLAPCLSGPHTPSGAPEALREPHRF